MPIDTLEKPTALPRTRSYSTTNNTRPVALATWEFGRIACDQSIRLLLKGQSILDAVESGITAVEDDPNVNSVGLGGLPNAAGVVELDAALMLGPEHRAGSVAALTDIAHPISVARRILETLPHVMLVGESARRFALQQGFPTCNLLTPAAKSSYEKWLSTERQNPPIGPSNHDTITLLVRDDHQNLAAGCSTSGLAWKTPGRVGDSPIIGAGIYVDNEVGAAGETGNGDEIVKVALSYRVVIMMEKGATAQEACVEAIHYLTQKCGDHLTGGAAVIAIRSDGSIGNAATSSGFTRSRRWLYAVNLSGRTEVREGRYVD